MKQEKKERMRKNLQLVADYLNLSKAEREAVLLEEQKQKFFERGGTIKRLEMPSEIDFTITDQLEAIEFLAD